LLGAEPSSLLKDRWPTAASVGAPVEWPLIIGRDQPEKAERGAEKMSAIV
jgi:hypothetical protein